MNMYFLDKEEINYFTNKKQDDSKKNNCLQMKQYKECSNPSSMFGYNRPLNEQCTIITGQLSNSPKDGCSSLWNNMTKRKSLIIKDKRK